MIYRYIISPDYKSVTIYLSHPKVPDLMFPIMVFEYNHFCEFIDDGLQAIECMMGVNKGLNKKIIDFINSIGE